MTKSIKRVSDDGVGKRRETRCGSEHGEPRKTPRVAHATFGGVEHIAHRQARVPSKVGSPDPSGWCRRGSGLSCPRGQSAATGARQHTGSLLTGIYSIDGLSEGSQAEKFVTGKSALAAGGKIDRHRRRGVSADSKILRVGMQRGGAGASGKDLDGEVGERSGRDAVVVYEVGGSGEVLKDAGIEGRGSRDKGHGDGPAGDEPGSGLIGEEDRGVVDPSLPVAGSRGAGTESLVELDCQGSCAQDELCEHRDRCTKRRRES